MKTIDYIKQPTEYLCGHACVAMLAGVTVEEVVSVMKNDKGTGKKDIEKALNYYGISQAKTMKKADNSSVLPKVCILKVLLPKYSHWVLYYDGKYYDPEFGLMEEIYQKARIQSYLEIFVDEDQGYNLQTQSGLLMFCIEFIEKRGILPQRQLPLCALATQASSNDK